MCAHDALRTSASRKKMSPRIHTGVKGGKYVLSTTGEKLYVPKQAAAWSLTNHGRWRLTLQVGRSMVYPPLQN